MLSRSVDPGKWLLVQEAYKTMLCSNLLHYLHSKLIVVCCPVCRGVDRSKLVLCRSHLVMLCLGQDPQLPQLLVQVCHILCNLGCY